MRSCRVEWRGAGVAALLLLAMAPALAQQPGPPIRLVPPPPGAAPAPLPLPTTPPPPDLSPQPRPSGTNPVLPPPPSGEPPPALATGEGVTTTPLKRIDAAWIGTLGAAERPLPQTMWQGTPRALVADALGALGPTNSPALQGLTRRLLLSNADAPEGSDPPGEPSLVERRLGRIMALGDVDGALSVLETLPPPQRAAEPLARRRVELTFARNDAAAACQQVRDGVGQYQGPWWARALIACQALAGERDKAALGLSLLKEQRAPPDPVFDQLVNALLGRPTKLEKLPEPSPLHLALLAAAKLPLPESAVATADLASLKQWATNEQLPPLQRIAAAERATRLGALPPAALGALYAKVEVRPEELGAAIRHGKPPASARERALLYQLARTDPATGVRATAIKALLAEATAHGDFISAARVVAPILAEIPPSDALAPFAAEAARALIAAGEAETAMAWLAYVKDGATRADLAALIALGSGRPVAGAASEEGHPSASPRAGMLLALRAGLGEEVPAAQWAGQLGAAHETTVPSIAVWLDQQRAATDRRVGETVLMTLLLARNGERLSAEPIVLARAISGLELVGLDGDARALAVEAALGAGA